MSNQPPSKEQLLEQLTNILYSLHLTLDVNNDVPQSVRTSCGMLRIRNWICGIRDRLQKFEEAFRASNEPCPACGGTKQALEDRGNFEPTLGPCSACATPPPPVDEGAIHPSTREQQEGLLNPVEQVMFRAGLLACRAYMASFVESGGNKIIADSIRANWWPCLGDDPGSPRKNTFQELTVGEYGEPGFRVKTREEVSPSIEALPVAVGFLIHKCGWPEAHYSTATKRLCNHYEEFKRADGSCLLCITPGEEESR